ncbi:MAG: YceI family protein [Rubricoccaceae bacterium]|nr:YceI family protein [Rubricoccaceae bacterium]
MTTTTPDVAVQTYAVDPSHSRLGFVVRHLGFSKVRGAFEQFEGTVRMAPGDLSTLEADAAIQAQSITTNEEKRDAHLRSADFFEVETYPTIAFESAEVRDVDGRRFTLVGDLTMHGVTERVALDAEFLGEGPDPWGGTRIAFDARTKVNRKEFGLNWNVALEAGGWLVSEDVEIVLEVQAVLQQDEEA